MEPHPSLFAPPRLRVESKMTEGQNPSSSLPACRNPTKWKKWKEPRIFHFTRARGFCVFCVFSRPAERAPLMLLSANFAVGLFERSEQARHILVLHVGDPPARSGPD